MTGDAVQPGPERPRRSGVVRPERATLGGRMVAALVCAIVRTVDATIRYQVEDVSGGLALAERDRVIFAIWHNRLSLSLMLYRRLIRKKHPERRMAAMVSASRDGGLLARVLEWFGVTPVRGSSSRRGPQAMLELTTWAERGYDLAITPDGPRGPRYVVQEGVIAAAQLTGLPILPTSFRLQWKWQAKSWDRFQVPLPFSRCQLRLGAPIRVPRDSGDAGREACRRQLEESLRAITED